MSGPILVARIAGTPFTLNDLRPDTRLMEIPGALLHTGHGVAVLDAANFETYEMLYPEESRADTYEWALRQLQSAYSSLFVRGGGADFALPSKLIKHQRAVFEKLGERIVARTDPAAVCFKVNSRKDLRPTMLAAARVRATRPRARIFAFGDAFHDDQTLSRALEAFDAVMLGPDLPIAELCAAANRRAWRPIANLAYYEGSQLVLTRRDGDASPARGAHLERFLYTASPAYSKIRVFDVFAVRSGVGAGSMDAGIATDHAETIGAIRATIDAFGSHTMCIRPSGGNDAGLERALLSNDLGISYSTTIDPAETARTRLGLLSACGCAAIDIPVHSGSQRLLDTHYQENFTVTQVERLARAAKFSGLFTSMHFTFPCREDDYHTEDETVRLVRRANPNSAVISPPPSHDVPGGGALALEFAPLRRRAVARARKQNAELGRKLRELNVPVGVDATTALVAGLAGFRGRESAFVELVGLQLLSGDTTGLAETIEQINDAARRPARALVFKPFVAAQNAAAN